MARVKSPYSEPMFDAGLFRVVEPGEIVEVPDQRLPNYLEAGWTAAQDKGTKKAVEQLDKAIPTSGEEQG